MTIAAEFEYIKPSTLGRAIKALAQHPEAQVLAGGTDLVSWISEDLVAPDALIDIKGIKNLDRIRFSKGILSLGCLVTFADLLNSDRIRKKAPLLCEMAGRVASTGIRNRATVVGNICSAVPCTDAGASLLVYDAVVHVTGPDGPRDIPLSEWFVGPRKTSRQRGEIATGVSFAVPASPSGGCWMKLGRYRGEDLAQASVAVLALPDNQYRVSFGSVAPRPIRGTRIEELLNGQPLSDDLLQQATDLVPETISPITDIRASREYRMEMVKVMLRRGLETAVTRRTSKGNIHVAPTNGEIL
jgi:carbon-monoxide dehydrogenase medium subunit